MNIFYVVWDQQSKTLSMQHNSELAAVREAGRLANLHPEKNFFVLRATCGFVSKHISEFQTLYFAA